MNLAIFDIDGTLTQSVAVDEVCFVQTFRDVLGIERINTNWLESTLPEDQKKTVLSGDFGPVVPQLGVSKVLRSGTLLILLAPSSDNCGFGGCSK